MSSWQSVAQWCEAVLDRIDSYRKAVEYVRTMPRRYLYGGSGLVLALFIYWRLNRSSRHTILDEEVYF